jgi:V8-like Glu-specific endopeptidase
MRPLLLLALLTGAGCLPEGDAVDSTHSAIVGGAFEEGEPAVVVVRTLGGFGLCTGTLISPHVVLTAKHCVQDAGADRPWPPSALSVGFGSVNDEIEGMRVIELRTTPGTYTSEPGVGLAGDLVGIDVATLTLLEPVTTVTPIIVGRERPTTGTEFTAVGFGLRPEGMPSGLKYKTTSTIGSISGDVLLTSNTICQGDSGGPAIIEGSPRTVVAVASFGEAGTAEEPACPSSRDGYNLVEPFLGLIDASMIAAGDCPFVAEESCNSVDDDCDGMVDEGCLGLGEACAADDECAFAQLPERFEPLDNPVFCGEVSGARRCTRRCDPTLPATTCADVTLPFTEEVMETPGTYCVVVDGCEGLCAPGVAGDALVDEPCTEDAECSSLRCVDPGDGRQRCLSPCVGDAGFCPVSEVCAASSGSCGACVAPELVGSPRGLGERCAADAECASMTCREEEERAYCSRACERDEECGDGFHCRDSLCALGDRSTTGEPCVDEGDCLLGDSCSHGYCTRLCSVDGSCPEGFHCGGGLCTLDGRRSVLGDPCDEEDAACAIGVCREVGDGTRCTVECGAAGTCQSGLECRRVEGDLFCVPPDVSPPVVPTLGGGGGCAAASETGKVPLAPVVLLALGLAWRRTRL